jgi:hypothetical protein
MNRLREHRTFLGWLMIVVMTLWLPQSQGYGATFFWDPDQSALIWDTSRRQLRRLGERQHQPRGV